jgi:hypothetical protein
VDESGINVAFAEPSPVASPSAKDKYGTYSKKATAASPGYARKDQTENKFSTYTRKPMSPKPTASPKPVQSFQTPGKVFAKFYA